jgi:hypothetical protein
MKTISITTVSAINGDRLYHAVMGSQQSTGKTAGEALDALTMQMGNTELDFGHFYICCSSNLPNR